MDAHRTRVAPEYFSGPAPLTRTVSLLIVGAGHVFRIEEPIDALIQAEHPDVVALELDPNRYQGLLQRAAGTYDVEAAQKSAPAMYRRLAKFQEDLASSLGTNVGGEMLAAARAAQRVGSRVVLVDMNAQDLVGRLWAEMSLWERTRIFFASIAARIPWKRGRSVEQEVARYQANPTKYLDELGKSYPTLKRVLIDERNQHMAAQLRGLVQQGQRVVAVVGDGHVDGLNVLLSDLKPRAVRLAELRATKGARIQWKFGPNRDSVSFSFQQQSLEGTVEFAGRGSTPKLG